MATTTTYTRVDLPLSEGSHSSAPTMSLVPASPPTSGPISPSTFTDSSSATLSPLSSAPTEEPPAPPDPLAPATVFSTFHSFPFLPREIQLIIWDFAIVSTGAFEKYEPYQLLIPAWKYFSTQPWHKGLSCCVPKRKLICGMMGGSRRKVIGNFALNHNEASRNGIDIEGWKGKEGGIAVESRGKTGSGRPLLDEEEMVKRSAHPHFNAVMCGKTIYLSPGWARSGLGGIANSCLTGRWLVMEYMKNGLEGFESGCLKVEKEHVLAVLREVIEGMDGRLRG